jgi:hypothetical protein
MDQLKEAIAARNEARTAVGAAEEALCRGKTLHTAALERVAGLAGVPAEIARHKANAIKTETSLELPDSLLDARRDHREAVDEASDYLDAVGHLTGDLAAARARLKECDYAVALEAEKIYAANASAKASKIRELQAGLKQEEDALLALATIWISTPQGSPRAIKLAPTAHALIGELQRSPQPYALNREKIAQRHEGERACFKALCENGEAL